MKSRRVSPRLLLCLLISPHSIDQNCRQTTLRVLSIPESHNYVFKIGFFFDSRRNMNSMKITIKIITFKPITYVYSHSTLIFFRYLFIYLFDIAGTLFEPKANVSF